MVQKSTASEKKSLEAVLFIISNRMKEAKLYRNICDIIPTL